MSGVHQRKLRKRLFERFGCCFHCKKQLVLDAENPNQHNIACLENKYSRWSKERSRDGWGELRWRIVCLSCSRNRDKQLSQIVPIEILRSKSGAYPMTEEKKKEVIKILGKKVNELFYFYEQTPKARIEQDKNK